MNYSGTFDNNLIELINVGKLIRVLKDIKQVKDAFPGIEVSTNANYTKLKINKNLKYDNVAEMTLSYDENSWIILSHSFPDKSVSNLLKIGSSINIKSTVENFILTIHNLQNYFEALYILDLNCIVLEPVIKSPKLNWRLIKYSKFAFIRIEFIDPLDINNFQIKFCGKDHIIQELNETYNNCSENYGDDEEIDIYQRLCIRLKILEFPYTNRIEDTVECAICLCHHNEQDESPIICCENPKCEQLFHGSCLNQHLNINSKAIKILNVSIGECPFCKMKISSNFESIIRQQNEVFQDTAKNNKNVIQQMETN